MTLLSPSSSPSFSEHLQQSSDGRACSREEVFFTLLGITFRSKDIVDAHYSRGMDEADDTIEEIVESSAERLGLVGLLCWAFMAGAGS